MSVSDPAALHRPARQLPRGAGSTGRRICGLLPCTPSIHTSPRCIQRPPHGEIARSRGGIWSIRRLRRGERPIQARRSFRSLEGIRRRSRRAADVGKFRPSLLPPALERNTATAASRQSGLHPDGDTNPTRQLLHEAFYINPTKNCTNAGGRLFFFVIRIATSGLTRGDPSHMFRATLSSHLH